MGTYIDYYRKYEVLDSIHSNPVCVLSHSTQMKPVPTASPVINEVVPDMGPPTGGTRVAVLGSNFVDSPAARIRFDTTDVMPIFHGPGTLICHTPQHQPGQVSVRVCNSAKKWSETSASFTYDSSLEKIRDAMYDSIMARQNFGTINEASWQGNYDAVRRLQETGANINAIDPRGYAPIHYACANAFLEICNFLLEKGAEVNLPDKTGATALLWAAVMGNEEIVQLLVEHGANPNLQTYDGVTPLMAAILEGHIQLALLLLENGASPNIATSRGETPLHAAAWLGFTTIMLQLLQHGAFLHVTDEERDSPLHWAVYASNVLHSITLTYFQPDAARELVKLGIDVNCSNVEQETPLYLATVLRDQQMTTALLQLGATRDETSGDNLTLFMEISPGEKEQLFSLSSKKNIPVCNVTRGESSWPWCTKRACSVFNGTCYLSSTAVQTLG